jgi:glycosyltransferase involved in cell wall biosynthesis
MTTRTIRHAASAGAVDDGSRDPVVTVLMPTYNRAPLLRDAIDSVLGQRAGDLELIVVDDGSTDDTATVVASYGDSRVRYLARPHLGISAALNAGITYARGCYVARLDSDDRWTSDLLATLVAVLESRPDAGVASGLGQAMDAAGRPLPYTLGHRPRFPEDDLRSLLFDDWTCNVALLVRRTCLADAGPYDETLIANEDWDMWLRVARRHRFVFVDRVLAYVRRHDGSLTATTSPHFAAVLDGRVVPLDKLFGDRDLPAAVRAQRRSAYANLHMFRGLRWLQARARARAVRELGRALRTADHRTVMAARIVWRACLVPWLERSALGRRVALMPTRRRVRGARRAR